MSSCEDVGAIKICTTLHYETYVVKCQNLGGRVHLDLGLSNCDLIAQIITGVNRVEDTLFISLYPFLNRHRDKQVNHEVE